MNPQLQNAISDVLKALLSAAQTVGSVAQEQLPLLVQEYIRWGIGAALFFMVLGVMGGMAGGYLMRRGLYLKEQAEPYDETPGFGHFLVGCALLVAGNLFFWINLYTLIQIQLAPRVWLLEQLAHLVK